MNNTYKNGIMGVLLGDALGCPVQFMSRDAIKNRPKGPVTGMDGYGTFNMPPGTWTDDGALTLATYASIKDNQGVNPVDIMDRFLDWYYKGHYTPYGKAFDQGITCTDAIWHYRRHHDITTCGLIDTYSNGNGALMRILPVCIYYVKHQNDYTMDQIIDSITTVGGLTHNHIRSHIANILYYFMVKAVIDGDGSLNDRIAVGLKSGFDYLDAHKKYHHDTSFYSSLRDLTAFKSTPVDDIQGTGYVVCTLQAVIWCILNTDNLADALLTAVNLGDDTDTVAAIAGGLAALYYGYDSVPADWLNTLHDVTI